MLSHHVSEWVSDTRFEPFLKAKDGDVESAAALYEWHARMCGSGYATLHHFEVLVRTAVDRQLGAGQPDEPIEATWLMDAGVLNERAREQVQDVLDRLDQQRRPRVRSRLVAGLTFVFWRNLFNKEYEQLWRTSLHQAFPGAGLRSEILRPLMHLHLWRNRIAHHESILEERIDERLEEMVRVAGFVDPDAAEWLKGQSDMQTVLAARP